MPQTAGVKRANHWFHVPILLVGLCFVVYWYFHVPTPSKALLLLSAIVALMMLLEMRPIHKGFYITLIIFLVLIENNASNKARADELSRREQENQKFQGIADQIGTAIRQNQTHFAATISGIEQNINTITGGKSFCYLWLTGNGTLPIFTQSGDYPLSDVTARIVDLDKFNQIVAKSPHPSLQEFLSADTNVNIGNLAVHSAIEKGTVHLTGQSANFNIFLVRATAFGLSNFGCA